MTAVTSVTTATTTAGNTIYSEPELQLTPVCMRYMNHDDIEATCDIDDLDHHPSDDISGYLDDKPQVLRVQPLPKMINY